MKKKAEKKNKNFEFGQVMSLLENMDGGIKVISEQYGDIKSELKTHGRKLGTIENKLEEHDQKFDVIEKRIGGVDTRLASVENKVDLMQEDITEIKHKLSEKVDREEFNKLEKRMVRLEKLVFAKT